MSRTRKHKNWHRHFGRRWCWCCTIAELLRFKARKGKPRDIGQEVLDGVRELKERG